MFDKIFIERLSKVSINKLMSKCFSVKMKLIINKFINNIPLIVVILHDVIKNSSLRVFPYNLIFLRYVFLNNIIVS